MLGAGHDASTTLHLAEVLAGVPYGVPGHCTVVVDGRPVRVEYRENDHCCRRFALLDGLLGARQGVGMVGYAETRLFRARDAVEVAVSRLAVEPRLSSRIGPRGGAAIYSLSAISRCVLPAWDELRA